MDPTRRDFIGKACLASAVATGALAGGPAVDYLLPRTEPGPRGPVDLGPSDQVPEGGGRSLVAPDGTPVLVIRTEGHLTALNPICTHLKCRVKWDEKAALVRCPCHGATFRRDGSGPTSPASKALTSYPILERDGHLLVTF